MATNKRNLLLGMVLVFLLAGNVFSAGDLALSMDGKSSYAIVQGQSPTEAESFAAGELAGYLEQVTGVKFPVVTETENFSCTHGIYVGWTDFAGKRGINLSGLGKEEWILRASGDNLILTGGRPRGTLYAVYEFLESQVGCLWLDRDTEVVPSIRNLTVKRLDIRSKPAFWWRGFYGGFYHLKPDKNVSSREELFRVRNKGNAEDSPSYKAQFGFGERMGPPGNCHTFFRYVDPKVWIEKHPEYFSYDGSSDRLGSICVTHPEVRQIAVKQLKNFIAQGRESALQRGAPPPVVYDISQQDAVSNMCRCHACKEIIEREGSESGPNVEFINAIADAIREEYPDVLIQTFAYASTEQPPKTLTVRDNVIIRWCDLHSKSEAVRPLTHQFNREQAAMVRRWGKIAKNLFVWDYWWHGFASPDVNIQTIQPDLKFFHENNVTGLFIEAEEWDPKQSFFALGCWLAHKMMQDPYQQTGPLVDKFMEGYYGPAAPKVMEWLRYVRERIEKNPDKIIDSSPSKSSRRRHWDIDFFVKAGTLFNDALDVCPPESKYRLHVQNEFIPVLSLLTERFSELEAEASANGQTFPFDRKEVVGRYKSMWKEQLSVNRSKVWSAQFSERVTEFTWKDMHKYGSSITEDSEAAGGKALCLTKGLTGIDHTLRPHVMGVYDATRKAAGPEVRLQDADIPQDEKYHLHKIGHFRIAPNTIVWAHRSWLLSCFIDRAYQLDDGIDPALNDWDIYVSLKFTGPAYVKGSVRENAVWMDRVMLVKPQ